MEGDRNIKIGFIGQGFIGKNYADDFENRGYSPVRYALEEAYIGNKEKVAECDIVFIAVPTPTTPGGFDDSIVRGAVALVGKGKIAVIKSTMVVGTTESIQKQHEDRIVMHSPEFLVESTAAYDAAHPNRNIIGIPSETEAYKRAAEKVLSVLPEAPFTLVCSAREAELVKYAGNCFLYTKVMFANLMHDIAEASGVSWDNIRAGMAADPRIGSSHLRVVDASRHPGAKPGRGAGGHCFIKDFAAFRAMHDQLLPEDIYGSEILRAMEEHNNQLLIESGKDLELLESVYGAEYVETRSHDAS